jgi:hypothetical protein
MRSVASRSMTPCCLPYDEYEYMDDCNVSIDGTLKQSKIRKARKWACVQIDNGMGMFKKTCGFRDETQLWGSAGWGISILDVGCPLLHGLLQTANAAVSERDPFSSECTRLCAIRQRDCFTKNFLILLPDDPTLLFSFTHAHGLPRHDKPSSLKTDVDILFFDTRYIEFSRHLRDRCSGE